VVIKQLFEKMWQDYTTLNPSVAQVHNVFTDAGEKSVSNDHVAFRTYSHPKIGLKEFSKVFTANGYVSKGEYHFKAKKLYAQHFEHSDENLPKVFISELLTEKMSEPTQKKISNLIEQMDFSITSKEDFCVSGRPWDVSHKDYTTLLEESEYAAWMSAFGFRVNHFTVLVNRLEKFKDLANVNEAIKKAGFRLNTSGGEIKGTESIGLMQSSTLAEPVSVTFNDGTFSIPGCYYEFAQRYPVDGKLYQGFVEQSADKIFESTNVKN
jgi:hypothetical protein